MNKKLIIIFIVVLTTMIVGAGTALAFNGNQGASLEDKLEAIEERVDEESMTRDEADAIIAEISSCDEDCDESSECADHPEEGRGIFGNGVNDGTGAGNGVKDGNGNGNGAEDGNGYGNGAEDGNGNGNGAEDGNGKGNGAEDGAGHRAENGRNKG